MFVKFIESLNSLKYKNVLFYLLLFTSIIPSGLAVIMVYFKDLFIELNNYKVIFLSLMIALPVLILNTLFYLSIVNLKCKNTGNFESMIYTSISLASIITLLEIYFAIVTCYLSGIDFKTFIIYLINLVFLVQFSIKLIENKRKKKSGR